METCAVFPIPQPPKSTPVDDPDFPALVKLSTKQKSVTPVDSPLPAYHPAKVTEVIEIPFDQRRFQNEEFMGGRRFDSQNRICMEIIKDTGVDININTSKLNMLTVILSGHPNKVLQAKKKVIAELRQQDTTKISVPQEYHGYLIGRRGERLRELQANTLTRISIPPSNAADPNVIVITGPKQGIMDAEQYIRETVEKHAQQGFERLDIPKVYHPFICGPNNQIVDELRSRTDTKINMPPRSIPANVITISGKRDGVACAAEEIQAIYEQAQLFKTIPVRVKKSQHHLVLGPRGSGLAEILAETGVSVEIPSDLSDEQILLRGRPENLGRALSMVYERAESSVMEEIPAANRFHKVLIGKRGSALAELCEGYEKVNVEFGDNKDTICVEGPPEEVSVIVERLKSRIAELESTMAIDRIRVDPKYFRHIIGRQGAMILRLREYNVQVQLPTMERGDTLAADEIIIQGDPTGIVKAKEEILQLVQKLENEKCKDVIIESRVQQLLLTGHKGPPPIRSIYDTFPKVSFLWPASNPTTEDMNDINNPSKTVVQLRGDRQQVDAAAERLNKLIKQVIEENHREEIRIFKEFRPHIFGRGSSKIQKLLDDTQTRMQYPNPIDDSEVFTIIGREENVQQAIKRLEDSQKQLANVKEVVVSIPSALTTKFVGTQAPSLRSICDQCSGVHMRFLNPKQQNQRNTSQVDVLMIGPAEAVDKAQELVKQLNARVAQLCAEELVHVDPKFHGYLIGRQGSNITRFRESHNVELIFPDRRETDPKLAMEIRIVGPKDAVAQAKNELIKFIKSIEDEIEESIAVDPSILRDLVDYRRAFPHPDLDRVRVLMPKAFGRFAVGGNNDEPCDNTSNAPSLPVNIKLIGQKACVEAAAQAMRSMLSDIVEQVTKEFPISDPNQFGALERARSQFREIERNYRVYISLRRSAPDHNQSDDQINSVHPTLCGTLIVTGRPERCELVYEEEIKPLLPIEEEYPLIKEFHRNLLTVPISERERQRRAAPRAKLQQNQPQQPDDSEPTQNAQSKASELRQKHGVFIRIPERQLVDADFVVLRGTPSQLLSAKTDLDEWVKQCEALRDDRIARAYEGSIEVPSRFIQSLVQLRPKLTAAHEVTMRFGADVAPSAAPPTGDSTTNSLPSTELNNSIAPEAQSNDTSPEHAVNGNVTQVGEERIATVIFRGYQEKVNAAIKDVEQAVDKLRSQVTENLYIPAEVHSYLIGSRGFAVQKLMQEYNVRIEFPNRNNRESGAANTVLVTGDEQDVDRACDFLISRANDLMDRFESETRTPKQKQHLVELLPSTGGGATN